VESPPDTEQHEPVSSPDPRADPDFRWKDCDWALYRPCGCTESVMLAAMPFSGRVIDNEAKAWKEFYDDGEPNRKARVNQAKRDGFRVVLLLRDQAVSAHLKRCSHDFIPRTGPPLTVPQEKALRAIEHAVRHGEDKVLNSFDPEAQGISRLTLQALDKRGLVIWEDVPPLTYTWDGQTYTHTDWWAQTTQAGTDWVDPPGMGPKEEGRVPQ
jgi:hypothetical protein